MKRPRGPFTLFGKYIELVQQIAKGNYGDRAIGVVKRFIQNNDLYQDCMAAFYIQNHPQGRQSIQLLYIEACILRRQVENLKFALAEEKDLGMLENIEGMINTLESKIAENLREYAKFSTLLGYQYCANPGNINQDIKQKVDNQIQRLPARQPISDSELLHAYYHYAGATANRTVGGTLATSIVTYFIDSANKARYEVPLKLAEIYVTLNRMASSREKFLRPTDTTVDMDKARAIIKDLNKSTPKGENSSSHAKLYEMRQRLKAGQMPEDLRGIALEIFLTDFNQGLEIALLDLQKIIAQTSVESQESQEELVKLSKELGSIFDDIEAERHTMVQFRSKHPE